MTALLLAPAEHAVLAAVADAGGILLGTRLVAAGHRPRVIAGLVARGMLLRIRRRWIASPEADPLALAAAREGVVISCITRARQLGLWVLDADGPVHVAADPHGRSARVSAGTVVHWHKPLVPRPPGTLYDGIENTLAAVIACRPEEAALAVVESALRPGLVEREALLRLPLTAAARALVEAASPWSDSGLETLFRVRLRWMRLPIRAQIWIAGHRVDFLIGDRLVVQIDGGHHVGRQRDEDNAHDAALTLMGYHVIRIGYDQIVNHWEQVQDLIMRAVAQGLHRAA